MHINFFVFILQQLTKKRALGVFCIDQATSWEPFSAAPIAYLDRHNVACPQTYLLASFKLIREGNFNKARVRYLYRCCRLTV